MVEEPDWTLVTWEGNRRRQHREFSCSAHVAAGARFRCMLANLVAFFASSCGPGVLAAYVFGSHARGTTHAESDVDIGVLLDRQVLPTRAARAAFAERLTTEIIGVTHRNAVDVVVLNDAPPELAVTVLDTGRLLRNVNDAEHHAFVRTARLRLADLKPFLDRARRRKLDAIAR